MSPTSAETHFDLILLPPFLSSLPLSRYHDARMVNYDTDDGVSVTSNRHKSSILTVQNATIRHGGNYTCAPANAKPTSISVHVLKGRCPSITTLDMYVPSLAMYIFICNIRLQLQ